MGNPPSTPVTATRQQYIADLVAARRRRGLRQSDLAAHVGVNGVSQQMLSAWEAGSVQPAPRSLAAWARALDADPYPEKLPAPPTCGTYKGYQAHGRRGEPRCDACKAANTIYMMIYRVARRTQVVP